MLSHLSFDKVWLVDDGRVEAHNVSNSVYTTRDIGAQKVQALAGHLYVKNEEIKSIPLFVTVEPKHLWYADVIVDTFDNAEARKSTIRYDHTIHAGVSEAKSADIMWNDIYDPHEDTHPRGENPVCTHHLGAPIILLTASLTAWSVQQYIATGKRLNYHITPAGKILQLEV